MNNSEPIKRTVERIDQAVLNLVFSHPDEGMLPAARKLEMAHALTRFVVEAVQKYYRGQIEHGGDICDKDLEMEIRHERIDMFWYNEAQQWKKKFVDTSAVGCNKPSIQ